MSDNKASGSASKNREVPDHLTYPLPRDQNFTELFGYVREQRAAFLAELREMLEADEEACFASREHLPCLSQAIHELHLEVRNTIVTGDYFRCAECGQLRNTSFIDGDGDGETCVDCMAREAEEEEREFEASRARGEVYLGHGRYARPEEF